MKSVLFQLTAVACIVTVLTGAASAQDNLSGIWQQKLLMPSGEWKNAGTFEVREDPSGKLSMTPHRQPNSPDLIPSNGISNVEQVADVWTFDSDWGNGNLGSFVLKADKRGRYVGYSYLNGQKRTLNLWIRIEQTPGVFVNGEPVKSTLDLPGQRTPSSTRTKQKSLQESVSNTTWRSDYLYNNRQNKDTTVLNFHADGTLTGTARIQAGRYIDVHTEIEGKWEVKGGSILITASEVSASAFGDYNKLLLANDEKTELTISTERYRSPFKKIEK